MSGSNRVPLRPKRADKHSIGFNPVGRINLAPFRGAAAAEANRFLPKLRRRARLRNRSGAHGSLNDTLYLHDLILGQPPQDSTAADSNSSADRRHDGSPLQIFSPSLYFFSLPFLRARDAKILRTVKMIDTIRFHVHPEIAYTRSIEHVKLGIVSSSSVSRRGEETL